MKSILNGALSMVEESKREAIDRHDEEIIAEAKAAQRDRDILAATRAFVELKQSDAEIFHLLNDFFDVENISDAESYALKARKIMQIRKLSNYLKGKGMTNLEFREFADKYRLEEKLLSNPKLLQLSPEKLEAAIKK